MKVKTAIRAFEITLVVALAGGVRWIIEQLDVGRVAGALGGG